jgi:tryptophanyl-tRNA synthetase
LQVERKRLVTGGRPTGRLNLGHHVGSPANCVRLQDEYGCFFSVADLHTLATRPERPGLPAIGKNVRPVVLDCLAAGIDPGCSTIFLQSAVPGTFELNLNFQLLVSVPRLERGPTLKEMASATELEAMPYGRLGYPVLQAADILLPRAHLVPVGKDNEALVEVAREVARRFNLLYGETFPIPELLLGEAPSLLGIDGLAKMSNARDNAVFLLDPAEVVAAKDRCMYTDPQRGRADIPGRVGGNPVFQYHEAFNRDRAEIEDVKVRYRSGTFGEVEVKGSLIERPEALLQPLRQRRAEFGRERSRVERVLAAESEQARRQAQATLREVRRATGLYLLPGA